MDLITSFAINIASSIALEIWNNSNKTINNQIKKAFDKALKDWSGDSEAREKKKSSLRIYVNYIFENPLVLSDRFYINEEYESFLVAFRKRICEYQEAYNYLSSITDLQRFKDELSLLKSIENKGIDTNTKVTMILDILENKPREENHKNIKAEPKLIKKALFNNYTADCEKFYLNREIDNKINTSIELSNLWIYGSSGIGKTALVNRNLIQNGVEYIYCDLSPISINCGDDVIGEIIHSICEKYSVSELPKSQNRIKVACDLLKTIESKELVIVIDELSIDGESLLKEITEVIVKLLTHHCNKSACSCLRFIISTINHPIIDSLVNGKARAHFEFIEIDGWNDDLIKLLEIIKVSISLNTNKEMDQIIIENSLNSPRLLKKIIKKICSSPQLDYENVKISSEQARKEYF